MGASSLIIVSLGALLGGCASTCQPGLANATALGGTSPETRVHDVVANGRDACERNAFPQGSVLRGKSPKCGSDEPVVGALDFTPTPPPPVLWLGPPYGFRPTTYCTPPRQVGAVTELESLWFPPAEMVCTSAW